MIHKTAIIDHKAKISTNVSIGAYTVIGPNVELGENSVIQSHVSIMGHTKIGKNNKIYSFASIGNDPQDLKFNGEKTNLGGGLTKVGNNCLFMVSSHIAHDCLVEDNVILANNVPLGGHAHIESNVIIGGNSAVQQFTRVGKSAMIGGMCGVVRDVIPYGIAHGNRSVLQGLNLIGLRRKNIPNKQIINLSDAYKEIFKDENLTQNLINLNQDFKKNELVLEVVNFLEKDKKRPICTPYSK
jgi:UDP-N-acetylglucosamine acyltransferase